MLGCKEPSDQSVEATASKKKTSMVNSESLKNHLPRSEQRNLPILSFNTSIDQKNQLLLKKVIQKNSNKITGCFSLRGKDGSKLHLAATSFTIVIKEKKITETTSFDTKDNLFTNCISGVIQGNDLLGWDLGNKSVEVTLDPNNSVVR